MRPDRKLTNDEGSLLKALTAKGWRREPNTVDMTLIIDGEVVVKDLSIMQAAVWDISHSDCSGAYADGATVTVINGPYLGFTGTIIAATISCHYWVNVDVFGREIPVELTAAQIRLGGK
jgi:transcription antitermination factor NusG